MVKYCDVVGLKIHMIGYVHELYKELILDCIFNSMKYSYLNFRPEPGEGCIYVYSFDTGEQYVGQTLQKLSYRHVQHRSRGGTSKSGIVDNYIKSGAHNYSLVIVYIGPESNLDRMERYWITRLNTLYPTGLNFTDGGNLNKHHNIRSRKLQSEFRLKYAQEHPNVAKAFRNLMRDPQYLPKLHRTTHGRAFTLEHKEKIGGGISAHYENYPKSENMSDKERAVLKKMCEINSKKIG